MWKSITEDAERKPTMTDEMKESLYNDYYRKVFGYLKGKTNNYHLAEDLASDVFMKVYAKADTFDETKSSVSTWIYTITRNTLTDYFRSRRVFEEIPEEMSDGSDIEETVLNNEALEELAEALEKLDERERDIIILRYYKRMKLKDIAEVIGISYAYVKLLHNKALMLLKENL